MSEQGKPSVWNLTLQLSSGPRESYEARSKFVSRVGFRSQTNNPKPIAPKPFQDIAGLAISLNYNHDALSGIDQKLFESRLHSNLLLAHFVLNTIIPQLESVRQGKKLEANVLKLTSGDGEEAERLAVLAGEVWSDPADERAAHVLEGFPKLVDAYEKMSGGQMNKSFFEALVQKNLRLKNN